MFYKEDEHGQILEEGITEAGSISSFIAAGTSYSAHGVQMVPFYIYYSMFGYQRVGDLVWAAGDCRTRGFMLGGTAGRTTLNGEGLQHEDGHSHVLFSVVPNCRAYDPAFGYELAVIIQDGLRRMLGEQEDVFYYVTLMNENYRHPGRCPRAPRTGSCAGCTCCSEAPQRSRQAARAAARLRHDPARGDGRPPSCWSRTSACCADVWSVTSFTELRRDGIEVERHNMLHPLDEARTRIRDRAAGAVGAVPWSPPPTTSARCPDQIRQWVPGRVPDARHRRLRAQRLPPRAAPVLRGRSPLRGGGRAEASSPTDGAIDRKRCRRGDRQVRDRPRGADADDRMSAHRLDRRGPGHRRLRRRPDHRDPGLGRRHRGRRGSAGHAGVRQGDDGRAGAVRGRGQGDRRQRRRPVSQGTVADDGGGRGRRRRLTAAARGAPAEQAVGDRDTEADASRRPRPRSSPPSPPAGRASRRRRPQTATANGGGPVYASPSARRLARELGVDAAPGERQRTQGPDHQGRRPGGGRGAARRRAGAGGGPRRRSASAGSSSSPGRSRLREVRPGRARRALADPAHLGARTWPATG